MFAWFPVHFAACSLWLTADGTDLFWPILWLAILAAALIVENLTAEMVSVWFAPAAFVAMILSFFCEPTVQFLVFIALSALLIVLAKTVLQRFFKKKKELPASGIEQLVGKQAVVVESVDNEAEKGVVKINGQLWTARTDNPTDRPAAGEHVTIVSVDGCKLIVTSTR